MPESLIVVLLVFAVLGVATAEILSLLLDNKHVAVHCAVDMSLVEPDEVITLTYRVRNTGIWPQPFVGFSILFEDGVEIRESEAWKEEHAVNSMFGKMFSFAVSLKPHRAYRGKIHFSIRERGLYNLGRVYIETGDFLGFRSRARSYDLPERLICTARVLPEEQNVALSGGFMGEVSARRFILEDPSLVVGYREYTGYEPMKRISWTQTARTGQMMVKNLDYTMDADVAILVDEELCQKSAAEYCLSRVRTVCEQLEKAKVSYAVISNGDLFETRKGVGRKHSLEIQRRIGLSRFARYRNIDDVAAQLVSGDLLPRGWIVIAPETNDRLDRAVALLQASMSARVCLLTGREEGSHA